LRPKWFAFGGHIYRRQLYAHGDQRLAIAEALAEPGIPERALLDSGVIDAASRQLAPGCEAISIDQYGIYATAPNRSEERAFRVI